MSSYAGELLGIKVVMLGDAATGAKTSLLERYIKGIFRDFQETTIGAAFVAHKTVVDGVDIKLEIWGLLFTFTHLYIIMLLL